MECPDNLRYTREHEWVSLKDGVATVGITDHAQEELGDITFLELPDVGQTFDPDAGLAVIESVKAASDIHAPVGGTVDSVNDALEDEPETINTDPYGKGWICRLKGCAPDALESLMTAAQYREYIGA